MHGSSKIKFAIHSNIEITGKLLTVVLEIVDIVLMYAYS